MLHPTFIIDCQLIDFLLDGYESRSSRKAPTAIRKLLMMNEFMTGWLIFRLPTWQCRYRQDRSFAGPRVQAPPNSAGIRALSIR